MLQQHPVSFSLESFCKEKECTGTSLLTSKYHGEITKLKVLKNEFVGIMLPPLLSLCSTHSVWDLGHLSSGPLSPQPPGAPASSPATWGISIRSVHVSFSIIHFPEGRSTIVSSSCVQYQASHPEEKKIESRVSLSLGAYGVVRKGTVGDARSPCPLCDVRGRSCLTLHGVLGSRLVAESQQW